MLIYLFFKKEISFRATLSYSFLILSAGGYFFIFYKLFGLTAQDSVALSPMEIIQGFRSFAYWELARNIFLKSFLQVMFSISPFLIAAWLLHRKGLAFEKLTTSFLYLFFIFFSGLTAYSLLHRMQDAEQLWSLVASVSTSLVVLLIFVSVLSQHKKVFLHYLIVTTLPILLIWKADLFLHPKPILNEVVKEHISLKKTKPTFAFLRSNLDYTSKAKQHESIYFGQAYQLFNQYDPLRIICISTEEIDFITDEDLKYQSFLQYNRYLKAKGLDQRNPDSCKTLFLNDYKIDYLLVSPKATFPEYISTNYQATSIGEIDSFKVYERRAQTID